MNTSTVFKLKNAELDSARISKAVFDRGNSCADKLVLTVFDAGDGAVDVSAGDPVEFWSGGVRKFFGFVSKSPRTLSASSQNVEIVAESPWGELERIVYQQLWNSAETLSGEVVLSPVMRSKVVLGQDSNGEKINVGPAGARHIGVRYFMRGKSADRHNRSFRGNDSGRGKRFVVR